MPKFLPRRTLSASVVMAAVCLATIVSFWTACSSDNSEKTSGSNGISSVDASKGLDQLSDGEASQYCTDLTGYYAASFSSGDLKNYLCDVSAVIASSFTSALSKDAAKAKTSCEEAYTKCQQAPSSGLGEAITSSPDCAAFQQSIKQCKDITIAQVNQCAADQITAFRRVAAVSPCDQLGSGGSPTTAAALGFTSPASCTQIQQKCPQANTLSNDNVRSPGSSLGGAGGSGGGSSSGSSGNAGNSALP